MKRAWKITSIVCFTFLLISLFICGILLYYLFHPASLKPLIEKGISHATGMSFSIQDLDYTLHPTRVRADGVLVGPGKDSRGFDLRLCHISADFDFEGPFGNRSLKVKNLILQGLTFHMTDELRLPDFGPAPTAPSFLGGIVKKIISLFFFKDIKVESAELENGKVEARSKDQVFLVDDIRASLDHADRVKIFCSAEMQWPSKGMHFKSPEIQLLTNDVISLMDPKINWSLSMKTAHFLTPSGRADGINLVADLLYTHSKREIFIAQVALIVDGVSSTPEGLEALPLHIILRSGVVDLLNQELVVPHLNLIIEDTVNLNGALEVWFGDRSRVSFELGVSRLLMEKLMPFVSHQLKAQQDQISLLGPVNFQGNISGRRVQGSWVWQCDIKSILAQNPFEYATARTRFNGNISGNIHLNGSFPDNEVSAMIQLHSTQITAHVADGNIKLPESSLNLDLLWKPPLFEIENLRAEILQAAFSIRGKNMDINDVRLNLQKGSMNLEKEMILLPEMHLDSSLLKNGILFLSLEKDHLQLELKAKKMDLVESAVNMDLLPRDWQFKADDGIDIKVTGNKKEILSVTSRLELEALQFQNPDSSCIGENLSMQTEINGQIDLGHQSVVLNAESRIRKGEVLYDRFYLNLVENAFFLHGNNMQYDISKASLKIPDLKLAVSHILQAKLKGFLIHETQNKHYKLSVTLPKTELNPIFRYFVLEPFQTENPGLKHLRPAGMISAEITLAEKGPSTTVIGHLNWDGGELSTGEKGLSMTGIHVSFPVWYQSETTRQSQNPLKGIIKIDNLTVPWFLNQPLTVDLIADHERLLIKSPTVFNLPGGQIKVGPILAENIFTSKSTVETSLILEQFHISPLLSKFWSKPVKGAINGKLEPIVLERGTVKSMGNIEITGFDGKVTLSNLGASGIFTAAPVFSFDAYLADLSLAEITAGTPFGKIEGILEGYVKNLEIAYGQAQRFDLLLETHEERGVSQKVSVKAVDNIARIGGTQSPFMGLAGRLASFFDTFGYKKIGVRASLDNDIFRINGTIKEKGSEYIMKRGPFSGVSIVNHNPDNQVRFKDMIKRIKRIQSGQKRGPK